MTGLDLSYAKSQALVIRRIADRLKAASIEIQLGGGVDWADHLQTEVGYLMDALAMTKEER